MTHDVDVLVVGGGPIGLAAAIEARMLGLTAVVVEPREPGIDKACGEGLMPGAVPALARLGVVPEGYPIRGVAYQSSRRRAEHRFRSGHALGVRRTVLSVTLSARAEAVGVVRLPARVESISQDPSGVAAAGLRARYLLGADGLHSTVRELVGLGVGVPPEGRRFGLRRHFLVAPWSDCIEVHWTRDVEAYVTPVAADTVGVAILGPVGTSFDAALATIPALAERVAGGVPASSLRGAGPFHQRTVRRSVGRVMLVGDASGYVDAITGEGIRVGLAQARAAIECISAARPGFYEREWMLRTRDFRLLTGGVVALGASAFRAGIVPAAVAFPRVFGGIVERLAR